MKKISSIHEMGISKHDKLLIVMPHPDDEAVFTSGLLYQSMKYNIPTRALTLTRGEKSSWRFGLNPEHDLSQARHNEQKNAYRILSISNYDIYFLPDGELESKQKEIHAILSKEIEQFNPTIITTLEPDGIYGHPDHIAVSQYCIRYKTKKRRVLYATVKPNFVFPKARWMSKKKHLSPIQAEFQLSMTPSEIFIKFRALCAHKTQFNNFLKWDTTKQFLINQFFTKEHYAFA